MTAHSDPIATPLAAAGSRFVQRIRRRYADQLPRLTPGKLQRTSILALYDSLRQDGQDVATALRGMLQEVVQDGTARRLAGGYVLPDGSPLPMGGKTGTGDNRLNTYARGGGLAGSKVTSRTATFVFYLGPRHFGTLTAFVLGSEAAEYKFTSALPTQILKSMVPLLRPVLTAGGDAHCPAGQRPELTAATAVAPAQQSH